MSRHFPFRWRPDVDRPTSVLVVASGTTEFDRAEIMALLDADHLSDLYPDRILFVHPRLGHDLFVEQARAAFGSGTLLRMGAHRVSIYSAPFDENGRCGAFGHVSGPDATWPDAAFEKVKRAGLIEVFQRRNVLMLPGPGTHFVHPSGVHSRSFLRGANAFVNGAETVFIAMTLLWHLDTDTRQIWLDSSSIASVAHAMTSLRQRFRPGFDPPHIESFSSYDGLRGNQLTHARKALVLISATASGNLARTIAKDHGVHHSRVVNLFSAADPAPDLTVHCDVSGHPTTRDGGGSLLRFTPSDACHWCADGSRLVRFVSDQFLADAIKYNEVMIVEKDAPDGLGDLLGRFHALRLFMIDRRDDSDQHRLWVDFGRLRTDERFIEEIRAATRRFAPISVSHVVHLDDEGSRWMAGIVVAEVARLGKEPEILDATSVPDIEACSAAVVVAACVGSGNALQVVSRDLRDVLGDNPRAYIVGMAKQGDATRLDKLRRDLVHSKSHPHDFVAIHRISLPDQDLTAWAAERSLLNTMSGRLGPSDPQQFVSLRLDALGRKLVDSVDQLFLGAPDSKPLKLSEGFAFWPVGYHTDAVSQGDVLATVAAVLHGMRTSRLGKSGEAKLASNAFHTAVLNPGVFGRFNDGIIQASLLRAAHPHELNYAGRPDLSSAMLRIVQRTIERWDASQGEACLEFLLAMATRRLTLAASDVTKLADMPLPPEAPDVVELMRRAATTQVFERDHADLGVDRPAASTWPHGARGS